MPQSVTTALLEKGGRFEPRALDGAARFHLEQCKQVFQGYLKSSVISDGVSPILRTTPPSRVSQFEFVDRWDINAWAILAEERPLIVFHSGIPFSLFEFFNSLLSRNETLKDIFGSTEPRSSVFSPPRLDYSYIKSGSWPSAIPLPAEQVGELKGSGSETNQDAKFVVHWSHYLKSKPSASNRSKFVSEAYITALHFLFCHELGHIDRGHLEFRNRHTNSFALHEVSHAQPPQKAVAAFDSMVLQTLEIDADMYALDRAIRMYLPKEGTGMRESSLGGREPGDPQCYRLFLFSVGVLFIFLEYQQMRRTRGFNLLKLLFSARTHPSYYARIHFLFLCSNALQHQAGADLIAICTASQQALHDLAQVIKLLGLRSDEFIAPKVRTASIVSSLRSKLNEIESELKECVAITRERYFRDGKQVTYSEGRRDPEDPYSLRGQALVILANGKEIRIPFLMEDAPIQAFLENSAKWEEGGYIDNAILYARMAISKDSQDVVAQGRLIALRAKLGRHAAAFDKLVSKHGLRSHLADKLSETVRLSNIRADPTRDLEMSEAVEVLEVAAALRPNDVVARLRLADCKMLLKDFAGAEREYRQAFAQNDLEQHRIQVLVGLGNCAAEFGRTGDAVQWFEQALSINRSDVHALRNLGIALVRGGRPEEAAPHLEHALKISPSDASLWFEYSAANYACKRFDKARELVERAIALAPQVTHYRDALAQLNRLSPHRPTE